MEARKLSNATEIRKATFAVPICNICNKEVDKFYMRREGDFLTLVAECHGDVSTKTFRESEIDSQYSHKAFQDPRRMHRQGRPIKLPSFRESQAIHFDKNLLRQRGIK